jgi:CBS domain-containing protein
VWSGIGTDFEGYHRVAANTAKEVVMTTARDIMTGGVECIGENESLEDAARKMRDLDVGSLPICGEDNRLKGMLTDRDIVTKCVAEGRDVRATRAGEFAEGEPVTIGADDGVEEILRTMKQHKVRRLPVIDGHDLVGMVSQGDVARNIDETKVGELVETISS